MYDLGPQFRFDLNKSTARLDCVFKGDKYRITVLTERLVRLEYNDNGMFEDYPTELVWYRNFPKPNFEVTETKKDIKITTKYFELYYVKEKKFSNNKFFAGSNLKISLVNTNKFWYYNHPEARRYNTDLYRLNGKIKQVKGLYSQDGFVSIDDSKTSLILENGSFKKRDNSGVDIYVFMYNKDFYYCLNDYYLLTGYPPLIPRYALGNWWSKDDIYSEESIEHLVKKFESNNVPLSIFLLDNWQNNNDLKFNNFYSNPKSLVDYLSSNKIKLGLSIKDSLEFKKDNYIYDVLKDYISVDKSGNIPFNLYDSRTIDAFLKLVISKLDLYGIDFYSIESINKNDLDRLTLLKHFLYYNNYKNENKRPLICAYNTLVAPHRYPISYAGESSVNWDTLEDIVNFNITASNLGISFISHDFGGTSDGIEDNELFTRFVQLGVFSPILRLGSKGGKYYKREPWKWGLKTANITTSYINLRYKLIPYIYTESYKYFKYGKTLIEPLYYTYPSLYDNPLYCKEYFFGSTFLISPILEKKDYVMNRVIHKIFIPAGTWYDFNTGKKYNGNKKYVSFYKDEEYPIFVKAGSIIPLAHNYFNDTSTPQNMEIDVFPGSNNTYSIYEDDGVSNEYLKGKYLITNIEFVYNKDQYKLTILPVSGEKGVISPTRNYRIKFKNTKPDVNVLSYVGSSSINNKYYKSDTDLIVDILNVPTTSQLTVIVSGKDIEIDSLRIINDDIVSVISDLPIKTVVKQKIDDIMFSNDLDLKKKRIQIKKLAHGKNYIERKYIDLLLKLLEYIYEV